MPVGDGPMICLGQKMAMIEMKVVIAKLIRKFKFSLVPSQSLDFSLSITLGLRGGLRLKFENRNYYRYSENLDSEIKLGYLQGLLLILYLRLLCKINNLCGNIRL